MFGGYYDTVEYKAIQGKDKFGTITYAEPDDKQVRFVKGQDVISIDGEKQIIRYKRIYHTPFEVKEGDLLDGHNVTDIRPSRDLHGNIHFYIVGTV